jgi:serine/threonine-protein kinase HipA
MISVFSDQKRAGRLSRFETRGSSFVYEPELDPDHAVSLTMPIRANSWDWHFGLLPIFEMNLPEGVLRARLERQFAKSLGHFDSLDLLSVTGRHQIGRLQYGAGEGEPSSAVFQSVDEILKARRDGELFEFLLSRYAGQSGVSGVQPKVLIRDESKFSKVQGRESVSLTAATHIVKLWEPGEYPELAANEYFCLRAAERAGLDVPIFDLSESGEALIIERFDLNMDGTYLGFEDFCVLNGLNSDRKYYGSYETRLFKRASDFLEPATSHQDLKTLFKLMVLNCVLRNGDAHLKNFGVIYDAIRGTVRLAPAYDIITTTAYLPQDGLALTLDGTTKWPDRAQLTRLGLARAEMSPSEINQTIEEVRAGVAETRSELSTRLQDSSSPEIGERMLTAWEEGLRLGA